MPRLPGEIRQKDFLNALRRLGIRRISGTGPHATFLNPATGGTTTVGLHYPVPRRHVRAALRDLGIPEEDFLDVL